MFIWVIIGFKIFLCIGLNVIMRVRGALINVAILLLISIILHMHIHDQLRMFFILAEHSKAIEVCIFSQCLSFTIRLLITSPQISFLGH